MLHVTARLTDDPTMRGLAVAGRNGDHLAVVMDCRLRARERAELMVELLDDDEFDAFVAYYQQTAIRTPGVPLPYPSLAVA